MTISTTTVLMGKGVKPAGFKNNRYIWEVTDKALAKIKANGIRFDKA